MPNEELGRRWQQMEVPIELFDGPYARRRSQLDELVVVPRGEMLEMDAGGGELEGGERPPMSKAASLYRVLAACQAPPLALSLQAGSKSRWGLGSTLPQRQA